LKHCGLFPHRTDARDYGDGACSAAGSKVWNYLPTDLRQPDLS